LPYRADPCLLKGRLRLALIVGIEAQPLVFLKGCSESRRLSAHRAASREKPNLLLCSLCVISAFVVYFSEINRLKAGQSN
jgi:hypothetical protein